MTWVGSSGGADRVSQSKFIPAMLGAWGFVRLSPFLVSIKGRCPSLPSSPEADFRMPCLPALGQPRPPQPCRRMGLQVPYGVLGANFQAA